MKSTKNQSSFIQFQFPIESQLDLIRQVDNKDTLQRNLNKLRQQNHYSSYNISFKIQQPYQYYLKQPKQTIIVQFKCCSPQSASEPSLVYERKLINSKLVYVLQDDCEILHKHTRKEIKGDNVNNQVKRENNNSKNIDSQKLEKEKNIRTIQDFKNKFNQYLKQVDDKIVDIGLINPETHGTEIQKKQEKPQQPKKIQQPTIENYQKKLQLTNSYTVTNYKPNSMPPIYFQKQKQIQRLKQVYKQQALKDQPPKIIQPTRKSARISQNKQIKTIGKTKLIQKQQKKQIIHKQKPKKTEPKQYNYGIYKKFYDERDDWSIKAVIQDDFINYNSKKVQRQKNNNQYVSYQKKLIKEQVQMMLQEVQQKKKLKNKKQVPLLNMIKSLMNYEDISQKQSLKLNRPPEQIKQSHLSYIKIWFRIIQKQLNWSLLQQPYQKLNLAKIIQKSFDNASQQNQINFNQIFQLFEEQSIYWNECLQLILQENNMKEFQYEKLNEKMGSGNNNKKNEQCMIKSYIDNSVVGLLKVKDFQEKVVYVYSIKINLINFRYNNRPNEAGQQKHPKNLQQPYKLILAFYLDQKLHPVLIWFNLIQIKQKNKNNLMQHSIKQYIQYKTLQTQFLQIIKSLKIFRIKFILLNFDTSLIKCMINIKQVLYNSIEATIKIDHLLHVCAIKEFLNGMEREGGSQFYVKISERIYREKKIGQYERLERWFKQEEGVFGGYNSQNPAIRENNQKDIRQLYTNYVQFLQLISLQPIQKPYYIGLSFLDNTFYQQNHQKNPILKIMNFFSIQNTPNHYHELIIAILVFFRFDPFRSLKQETPISEIFNEDYLINKYLGQYEKVVRGFHVENGQKGVQNKGMAVQGVGKNKTAINIKQTKQEKVKKINAIKQQPIINNDNLKVQLKIVKSILQNPIHEFIQIIKKCPIYIKSIINHLLHTSFDLQITKDIEQKIMQVKSIKVINKKTKQIFTVTIQKQNIHKHFRNIRKQNQKNQYLSLQNLLRYDQEMIKVISWKKISTGKIWNCECGFYVHTGVMCEHELFCSLSANTSVFQEVSQRWKRRQSLNSVLKPQRMDQQYN